MQMRLRHVVLVGRDLEPESRQLADVLGIEEAFREPPGLGLDMANIVMPIGTSFIEICVGTHAEAPARRYLERAGPGGYMVLLQFPGFEPARERARSRGARFVWEYDCDVQRECHLHPADVGGTMVGVEWSKNWEDWRWAGPQWRSHVRTDSVTGLAAATISAADPGAVSERWAELFGIEPVTQPDGSLEAAVGDQLIRFSQWQQQGSRLTGIDLRAADAAGIRRRAGAAGCEVDDGKVVVAGIEVRLLEDN
jgi:Glyoxalase-like domain